MCPKMSILAAEHLHLDGSQDLGLEIAALTVNEENMFTPDQIYVSMIKAVSLHRNGMKDVPL